MGVRRNLGYVEIEPYVEIKKPYVKIYIGLIVGGYFVLCIKSANSANSTTLK